MTIGAWVGLAVSVTIILGVFWRIARGIYRVVRVGEKALDRLDGVEAQLKTNGGNSLRDMADRIHAVVLANAETNARVEDEQRKAAALAGQAAALASTADQRIKELGQIAADRHRDNVRRLNWLEVAANEERIRREFYLATLRELYGIELDDPS